MSAEMIPGTGVQGTPGVSERVTTTSVIRVRRMRLAWAVIWLGLLGFVLVCGLGALGVFLYTTSASVSQTASVQRMHGSLLEVRRSGEREWRVVSEPFTTTLQEGDSVRTGPDTAAFIKLFDGSAVTVYYSTEVKLQTLQASRYGNQEKRIGVEQARGVVTYGLADRSPYARLDAVVTTAQARISLGDNTTVRISTLGAERNTPALTQVVVQGGTCVVSAANEYARPKPNEMVRVVDGRPLATPEPATDELLANGGFETLAEEPDEAFAGWAALPGPNAPIDGAHVVTHTEETAGEPRSIELTRADTQSGATRVTVKQDLNRQVSFYHSLILHLQVRVVEQGPETTPNGPYPLILQMHYYDQEGHERIWEQGFYFDPNASNAGSSSLTAARVKRGLWQPREYDLKKLAPDAVRLGWLDIIGNGTQFSVWVSELSLVGQ
jgi:hypothetical protein